MSKVKQENSYNKQWGRARFPLNKDVFRGTILNCWTSIPPHDLFRDVKRRKEKLDTVD